MYKHIYRGTFIKPVARVTSCNVSDFFTFWLSCSVRNEHHLIKLPLVIIYSLYTKFWFKFYRMSIKRSCEPIIYKPDGFSGCLV